MWTLKGIDLYKYPLDIESLSGVTVITVSMPGVHVPAIQGCGQVQGKPLGDTVQSQYTLAMRASARGHC